MPVYEAGELDGPIAISAHAAWVVNRGQSSVTRIDLGRRTPTQVALSAKPTAIIAAFGRIWIALDDKSVTVLNDDGRLAVVGKNKATSASSMSGPDKIIAGEVDRRSVVLSDMIGEGEFCQVFNGRFHVRNSNHARGILPPA